MILCENLTRYYGTFVAVDDLNVEIPRGSVCALIGPNGAGKSTTMKMLSTLLRPSKGRALICTQDVQKEPAAVRRLIGYLPEAFNLYEDMTIERYLQFFARAYNMPLADAGGRIKDFLERLGLTDKRAVKIAGLSRGMRQRLGVAKAFLHDPEVVFLDEPASGLDPVARTELRDFLRYQQHMGKTVVVSSHVLKELADFCDHVAIMQGGRLVEFGPLTGETGVLAKYSDTTQGGRRYTVRVITEPPRLELFLKECAHVSRVERRDTSLTFEFDGSEEESALLLQKIFAAGFLISKFSPEDIDLEHVYRKASGGARDD